MTLLNATGTKLQGNYTTSAIGDWTELNTVSLNTFPCSLQPISATESEYATYDKETSTALFKLYWQGSDSGGAAVSFKVDDKVQVASITYQVIGVSMDMAGRSRFYKAILQRVT